MKQLSYKKRYPLKKTTKYFAKETESCLMNVLKKMQKNTVLIGYYADLIFLDVGKCYDNAIMESFFVTSKKKKIYLMNTKVMNMQEVKKAILDYVDYYNIPIFIE